MKYPNISYQPAYIRQVSVAILCVVHTGDYSRRFSATRCFRRLIRRLSPFGDYSRRSRLQLIAEKPGMETIVADFGDCSQSIINAKRVIRKLWKLFLKYKRKVLRSTQPISVAEYCRRGGAENAELDIARLDNAAPYRKGGQRETWKCGAWSNRGVRAKRSRVVVYGCLITAFTVFIILYASCTLIVCCFYSD